MRKKIGIAALVVVVLSAVAVGVFARGGELTVPAQEKTIMEQYISNSGSVLIDVRTPEEYAQGHIPGAINIDISNPQFVEKVAEASAGKETAVYCRSGARSSHAAALLSKRGLRVTDLGGIHNYRGTLAQ